MLMSWRATDAPAGRARVKASIEVLAAVEALRAVRAQLAELDAREEEAKRIILGAMGECDTLVDDEGNILATWKASKPAQRFDAKALQAAHPDLYAKFLRAGEPSRRFILKD